MDKENKRSVNELIHEAKRIAFYGRVSTKEQEVDSRQLNVVEEFMKRFDREIAPEDQYQDTKSAYSKSYEVRKDLEALLQKVKAGEIDTIVVSDWDRLSRQVDDHFKLREVLKNKYNDVPVIIASKGELYSQDDLIKTLVEDGMSKLESDNISVRTRHALRTLLEKGQYIGGRPPFGYVYKKTEQRDKKKIEFKINPEQMDKVKRMYELYAKGETFHSIAEKLRAEEGIGEDKGKYSANKIKGIVLNPIYMGYFGYNRLRNKKGGYSLNPIGEWILIKNPFINESPPVTEELWLFCYERYNSFPTYSPSSFTFTNLIKCSCKASSDEPSYLKADDQRTEIKARKYGYRYYRCDFCSIKVSANKIEKKLKNTIMQLRKPNEVILEETKRLIKETYGERKAELTNLKNLLDREEDNLYQLRRHNPDLFFQDILLYESDRPLTLAYLISKNDSLNKVNELKKIIPTKELELGKLGKFLSETSKLQDVLDGIFKDMEALTNSEWRSVVLLLVEDCRLNESLTVNLKIKSLPPIMDIGF